MTAGVVGGVGLAGRAKDEVMKAAPQPMPGYLESYRDPAFGSRHSLCLQLRRN